MRRWKPPTPRLGRDAVVLALVILAAGALVWIAGHEARPERPTPPPPPDAAAPMVTARALPPDLETLVPPRPAAPNPPPAEPEAERLAAERAASSPPRRPATWTVIDAERYNLTPATVPLGTSYVERNNGTIRNQLRRFTRRTLAFSKLLRNLRAAVALYVCWYDFVRPHGALDGMTPAMALGIADTFWPLERLLP